MGSVQSRGTNVRYLDCDMSALCQRSFQKTGEDEFNNSSSTMPWLARRSFGEDLRDGTYLGDCEYGRSEAIAPFKTLARVGSEIRYTTNGSCLGVSSLKPNTGVRDTENSRKRGDRDCVVYMEVLKRKRHMRASRHACRTRTNFTLVRCERGET